MRSSVLPGEIGSGTILRRLERVIGFLLSGRGLFFFEILYQIFDGVFLGASFGSVMARSEAVDAVEAIDLVPVSGHEGADGGAEAAGERSQDGFVKDPFAGLVVLGGLIDPGEVVEGGAQFCLCLGGVEVFVLWWRGGGGGGVRRRFVSCRCLAGIATALALASLASISATVFATETLVV